IWALMGILFWKGYHQNNKKYLFIVGALYGLGIYAYDSLGFFALFIFVFMLLTTKLNFLKDKRIWYVILAAIIAIIPLATYHYIEFNNYFGESSNLLYEIYPRFGRFVISDFTPNEESTLDWQRPKGEVISEVFSYFTQMPYLMKWPFFIALLIGLTLLGNLILGFDLILKGKGGNLKKDLYMILWALSLMIPMGLVVGTTGFMFEPRLIFPAMPALFVIAGIGFMKLYNLISKYNKQLAIVTVVILLVLGVQMQLSFANNLINAKKDSFFQHNLGGTWLKEHTKVGDVIVGCGLSVNLVYYSEREFKSFGHNVTTADDLVEKYKPKYFVMDAFDPACTLDYPSMYREKFIPVQVYFLDPGKTMPVMIIYEVRY
ncbi:MAG: hypothetical protein KKF52_03890, partial [Nanoarchaeota archaeon]|nr:hypothetical protein [Nanoarchaeota archaeon]